MVIRFGPEEVIAPEAFDSQIGKTVPVYSGLPGTPGRRIVGEATVTKDDDESGSIGISVTIDPLEALRHKLSVVEDLSGSIHPTHNVVTRPIGGDECSACWRCTCHHPNALAAECKGTNGRNHGQILEG